VIEAEHTAALTARLEQQRSAYLADPIPDLTQRKLDLLSLKRMVTARAMRRCWPR